MGFFGTYLWGDGRWTAADRDALPSVDEPWLLVDIHDSDFTEVVYRPAGPGSGTAYLGITPRVYFESDDASAPADVTREAQGLAAWWALTHDLPGSDARVGIKAAELTAYLADDTEPPEDDGDEDDDLDDGDVFVEVKTARFIEVLGLPRIDDLPG